MSKDQAIRDAAAALLNAIVKGREAGFTVDWPNRWEGLDRMAVSETGKGRVIVQTDMRDVPKDVADKAAAAAQAAVDKVIETENAPVDLDTLKKEELEAPAARFNIDISAARTKAEIIDAIKAARS